MIKYVPEDTQVVFNEVPDEIALAINISNCQCRCVGCHSPYLREDVGKELTEKVLDELIKSNAGITCVALMGEGNDKERMKELILYLKKNYDLKIAVYSGRTDVDDCQFYFDYLDYLKIGPYIEEFGPLNKETTNQRFYEVRNINKATKINGKWRNHWFDVTEKFWNKNI